ncbi:MAG: endonuclease III [Dehalococcoidia bacterium]|nr:endonuclease III [Dehalococcoidia bacterium]
MGLKPEAIMQALEPLYGRPENRPSGDPVAELVLTILSQNTHDRNSGKAFVQLLTTFGSWAEIAMAEEAEVVEAIRGGGLAQQKGPRIQGALRGVAQRTGGDFQLDFLRDMELEEARTWLRSLPGVGPKTAACVLLFALGLPAMPVDTHVERVAKRLGLVPGKMTAEKAHAALEALVDPSDYYRFHMLLIKHGRRICAARKPACPACPLRRSCPASETR